MSPLISLAVREDDASIAQNNWTATTLSNVAAKVPAKVAVRKIAGKSRVAPKLTVAVTSPELLATRYRTDAMNMAKGCLRKWRAFLEFDELQSVVDLSLCEAARGFKPEKGAKFLTYLHFFLKGNLTRAISSRVQDKRLVLGGLEFARSSEAELPYSVDASVEADFTHGCCPERSFQQRRLLRQIAQMHQELSPVEQVVMERLLIQGEVLQDVASELGYSRGHLSRVRRRCMERIVALRENEL